MSNDSTRREFITGGTVAAGAAAAIAFVGGDATAHEVEINAMGPTPEALQAFMKLPDEPIVMVNLLKFKPGGAEAYRQYGRDVSKVLAKIGARLLFASEAKVCLIGLGDWDSIALVEYPNPRALIRMAQSADYQAISKNRDDGLAGQINYAVTQTQEI